MPEIQIEPQAEITKEEFVHMRDKADAAVEKMAGGSPIEMVRTAEATAMGVIAAMSVTGNIKRGS